MPAAHKSLILSLYSTSIVLRVVEYMVVQPGIHVLTLNCVESAREMLGVGAVNRRAEIFVTTSFTAFYKWMEMSRIMPEIKIEKSLSIN